MYSEIVFISEYSKVRKIKCYKAMFKYNLSVFGSYKIIKRKINAFL